MLTVLTGHDQKVKNLDAGDLGIKLSGTMNSKKAFIIRLYQDWPYKRLASAARLQLTELSVRISSNGILDSFPA